ncbi:TetR/AcrR family transcriptional regulator [Numidum massiliense]|uniref:TetR/AcrR family transcriptional regulator n=1 Tax=Numidum massiliense TaxID=1522315 RepID=UPI0006D57A41|nr:TetR/AcrR family transcriptional regulator [Numidum massiliense]
MAKNRNDTRAVETKQSILDSAATLFASRGFDTVTIREIARAAGCSHTTIYLYYKDKLDLLQQLSIPPLIELEQQMQTILDDGEVTPTEALHRLSYAFLHFALSNRSMYRLFLTVRAGRVDEEHVEMPLNQLRNQLFAHLREALRRCFPHAGTEANLLYTRIYFYMLHGVIETYLESTEPLDELIKRVAPLLDEALDVVLMGIQQKAANDEGSTTEGGKQ